jgi:hypothetical protein
MDAGPAPRYQDRRCRQLPHLIDKLHRGTRIKLRLGQTPSRAPSLRCSARSRVEVGTCTPSARRMKDGKPPSLPPASEYLSPR